MIAKGLDFPNVTLVGLMDADISLHLPDFRAHERTFQLLVQVAGRSGRGDRAGEVVVQTHQPHAAPIQFGRRQDYDGFAVAELENRREFLYPPYRHVIHHLFRGKNRDKVVFYADQWVRHLRTSLVAADATEIRGPAPCPVERVQDHFRQQAFYFCPTPSRLVPKLTALRQAFPWDRDIIETLDVDAISMG
jgi:primosomal protein N' (replication factor Y)